MAASAASRAPGSTRQASARRGPEFQDNAPNNGRRLRRLTTVRPASCGGYTATRRRSERADRRVRRDRAHRQRHDRGLDHHRQRGEPVDRQFRQGATQPRRVQQVAGGHVLGFAARGRGNLSRTLPSGTDNCFLENRNADSSEVNLFARGAAAPPLRWAATSGTRRPSRCRRPSLSGRLLGSDDRREPHPTASSPLCPAHCRASRSHRGPSSAPASRRSR